MEALRKKALFKNPVFMGGLVLVFVLVLSQYLAYQRYQLLKVTQQNRITHHAIGIEEKLQRIMNQSFAATKTLGFIIEKYGVPADFDSIAELLIASNEFIDVLEVVDGDGTITHVYPMPGNSVVGFNILEDSIGKSGALTTIKRKDYFTTGPIPLKQGGVGFVSRVPIFTGGSFNGFAATIVKLPTLLKAIDMDSLQKGPFSYQLSKINADRSEELFFASKNISSSYTFSMPIDMYNAEWKLNVISNENNTFNSVLIISILGFVLSCLCALVTWQFIRLPRYLSEVVKQKTLLLEESILKYKTLVEQASDGIFLVDQKGLILEVNIKGAELLGYKVNELLGLTLDDIYDVTELQERPIRFKELEEGKAILHERKMIRKNGSHFFAEVSAKKMFKGNIFGILRDITERKEARRILEQQNMELKKTNAELDSFVYSASHELRAPLASVLGLIHVMQLEENSSELQIQLSMMEKSIIRLDDFIKDIIEYSRNKHLTLQKEPIKFTNLIEECIEGLWYLENRKQIRVHIEVNDAVDFVSDKKRISILLNNFISNAIKYHDLKKERPSIWITVHTNEEEALVTIKDNGLGMEKEQLGKIFDMFYRISSQTMGSGIGLFIVKEVLDKLDGTITVASKLGEGTLFTIKLPNESNKIEN